MLMDVLLLTVAWCLVMLWSCSVVMEMSCRLGALVVCGQSVFFRLDEKLKIGLSEVSKIQGRSSDTIKNHLLVPSPTQGFPSS